MHGKQKIWFLINRIIDQKELTEVGKPIGLHPTHDLKNHYDPQEIINLSKKLEKEENAIKVLAKPSDRDQQRYYVKLLPGFDKYVAKLENDSEYLEWSGKKPKPRRLALGNQVDFDKSSDENKDAYVSVGQIQELLKKTEAERAKIMQYSLTEKQRKDVEEFGKTSVQLIKDIQSKLNFQIPKLVPELSDVSFALPPNYEAEQVMLLRQLVDQQEATKPAADSGQAISITYTKSRQVLLNDIFLLAQPVLNGENDLVFNHLYKHPNQSHTKKQLEAALTTRITKPFHKIVENLGFKGDLAKAFFSASKESIEFRNPIKADELAEMGLSIIKLNRTNNS